MFPSDLTDNPLLARSDKLIRSGAFVPMFGLCLIAFSGPLLNPSRGTFVAEVLGLGAIGQVLVWSGMDGLRRSCGWELTGVLFHTWMGGILAAAAAASTAVMYVVPIPLVAPVVATFARWRLRRAGATP